MTTETINKKIEQEKEQVLKEKLDENLIIVKNIKKFLKEQIIFELKLTIATEEDIDKYIASPSIIEIKNGDLLDFKITNFSLGLLHLFSFLKLNYAICKFEDIENDKYLIYLEDEFYIYYRARKRTSSKREKKLDENLIIVKNIKKFLKEQIIFELKLTIATEENKASSSIIEIKNGDLLNFTITNFSISLYYLFDSLKLDCAIYKFEDIENDKYLIYLEGEFYIYSKTINKEEIGQLKIEEII